MSIGLCLDNHVFAPGEAVSGTVTVRVGGGRLKLNGVRLKLQGRRVVRNGNDDADWREYGFGEDFSLGYWRGGSSDGRRVRRLVDLRHTCFGMRPSTSYLSRGTYRYPFRLTLPRDAPLSCYHAVHHRLGRSDYAVVEYQITAILDIPMSFDERYRLPIIVAQRPRPPAPGAPRTVMRLSPWRAEVSKGGIAGFLGYTKNGQYVRTTAWVAETAIVLPGVRREEARLFPGVEVGQWRGRSAKVVIRGLFPGAEAGSAGLRRLPPLLAPDSDDGPQLSMRVAVDNSTSKMTLRCLRVELENKVALTNWIAADVDKLRVLQEDIYYAGRPEVDDTGGGARRIKGIPPGTFAVVDFTIAAPPALMMYRPYGYRGGAAANTGIGRKRWCQDAERRATVYGRGPGGNSLYYPTLAGDFRHAKSTYRLRLSYPGTNLCDFTTQSSIHFVPIYPVRRSGGPAVGGSDVGFKKSSTGRQGNNAARLPAARPAAAVAAPVPVPVPPAQGTDYVYGVPITNQVAPGGNDGYYQTSEYVSGGGGGGGNNNLIHFDPSAPLLTDDAVTFSATPGGAAPPPPQPPQPPQQQQQQASSPSGTVTYGGVRPL